MISGIRWIAATSEWVEEKQLKRVPVKKTKHLELTYANEYTLICYCTKRISETEFLSVFTKREESTDDPYHCSQLPFPFYLPVYPRSDLFFVMYTEKSNPYAASIPFFLGPRDKIGTVSFKSLSMQTWSDVLLTCTAEADNGEYNMLQNAFDVLWEHAPDDEDDFFADDEVTTDLMLLTNATVTAAAASSDAQLQLPSSTYEEEWNEDEPIVDSRTGFVVEKSVAVNSEDEESDDDDDDDEKDDEEDLDMEDDEEEEEEENADLDLQIANDDV